MEAVDGPALQLLDAIAERYQLDDVPTGEQLPERQYMGHGQPGSVAADMPSLMVAMTGIDTRDRDSVGAPTAGSLVTHRASLLVRLLRPAAVFDDHGNPPSAAVITGEAEVLARDAARLLEAWHGWVRSLPPHLQVTPGAVEPISPGRRARRAAGHGQPRAAVAVARIEVRLRLEVGRIDVDQARWEAFARDPSGPIVRDMVRRGNNVEQTARFDAPRDTGTLAATIRTQLDFGARLPAVEVIAGRAGLTDYLGYVINGTKPHVIEAKRNRPNPHLRFLVGGVVVFRKRVQHPGTRADTFLTRALLRAAD